MSVHVDPVDWKTASEETLRQAHELLIIEEAHALPHDPPIPFAERKADLRMSRSARKKVAWLLFEGDRAVGLAEIVMGMVDNLNSSDVLLFLHPDVRGRGLARTLAKPVIEALEQHQRSRLVVEVSEGSPSIPLLEKLGFSFGMMETRSRLRIDELDRQLMASWIKRARERAGDYELLFFTDRMPDDLLVPYAELLGVMNTAPRESLEEEDESFTPEEIREVEDNFFRLGAELPAMVARHRPTGQLAGFTNMSYSDLNPPQLWQWGTGVDPAHRNRGLGRWLKAAMIEELMARFPQAERVDTYNAGSNEPMLNINIAMGFKPIANYHVYQGSLDAARRWVGEVG